MQGCTHSSNCHTRAEPLVSRRCASHFPCLSEESNQRKDTPVAAPVREKQKREPVPVLLGSDGAFRRGLCPGEKASAPASPATRPVHRNLRRSAGSRGPGIKSHGTATSKAKAPFSSPSFPRRRESSSDTECDDQKLDSRLRGNDKVFLTLPLLLTLGPPPERRASQAMAIRPRSGRGRSRSLSAAPGTARQKARHCREAQGEVSRFASIARSETERPAMDGRTGGY